MIKPEEIKKSLKNETLSMIKNLLLVLVIGLVGIFLQDKKFIFEEIICIVVILVIISFIETRVEKIGFIKNYKNMQKAYNEFIKYLTIDTISYKDIKDVEKKLEEILTKYPTNKKYRLEFLVSLYIRKLFDDLLISVQNDEIESNRVKELADVYEEYLDKDYVEKLKTSNDFFLVKKHHFLKEIEISSKVEKLAGETFIYTHSNIIVQRLSKIISKNAIIYYTNKRLLFTDENHNLIFDLYLSSINENTFCSLDKNAYIFTLKDEYIINLDDTIKRKQMNEIIAYYKGK